ncbi:MAG: valine--tRNA ligase, partial [Bacteroidales bacterium]
VNYKEVNSKLYYVRYSIVGREGDYVTIATTRPETILGDTAVCVNPADPRYEHLKGCHVVVPMVNREVPVIFDPYVDMEFGTGALKITPAHDENDYRIGLDHQLEIIDIFNDDGTLSEKAGLFIGIDRFKARKLAVELLEKEGFLVKVEDYRNKVGYSERTDAVIEPKLSRQWFMRMQELAGPALDCVMNDDVQLIPAKFKNTYRHWMENIKDWCISRQLWWGHRIPAWYLPDGQVVVSFNEELALAEAREITGNEGLLLDDLTQDEDVLDTWFSSWLWPISVFDGIRNPDNPDIKYYYPTNDLITAPEILFFWVARMIIAGHEFMGEKPFRNVYLTGIVRDGQRRKMSKSLGNSPEPLELIAKYGADGVRVGMLLCSPAGNDLLFDNSLTEQGRNFGNKIWNAFRLVSGWRVDPKREQPETSKLAASLFSARLNQDISILEDHFGKYRLSDALMTVYKLFWDDFSSWYLEMIKPGFGEPVDPITMAEAKSFFEKMMLLLHPFMPFITEEIWQHIGERKPGDSIMIAQLPDPKPVDEAWIVRYDQLKEVAVFIRSVRAEKNISPKTSLSLHVVAHQTTYDPTLDPLLIKLLNINKIAINGTQPEGCSSQIIRSIEYFVPFDQPVDVEEELARIRKEIDYTRGFLQSVEKKLANDRFLSHASPQVVDLEKKKWADANAKLTALTDTLERLLGAEER